MSDKYERRPRCGNCVAWVCGECRRYAPRPAMLLEMREEAKKGERRALNAFWPATYEYDYCMEWVRDPGEDQPPPMPACS